MQVIWTVGEWAAAIASLPAAGALPSRVVIVPGGRVAHALRRELCTAGRQDLLIGTRFVPAAALAAEILVDAGVVFTAGEETRRRVRVGQVFHAGMAFGHFKRDALISRPGWDAAFADAIADLEATGLAPETFSHDAEPQLADVLAVWRAVDAAAGDSWTSARILAEAARVVAEGHPVDGAVLAR